MDNRSLLAAKAQITNCDRSRPPRRFGWVLWPVSVTIALCVGLSASRANAQPLFGHVESIEYQVLNADFAVLAHVLRFESIDESQGTLKINLSVHETLKGEPQDMRSVMVQVPKSIVENWQANENELLLFGQTGDLISSSIVDLSDSELIVITEDFEALRDREQVIRHARKVIAGTRELEAKDGFSLILPRDVVAGSPLADFYGSGGYTRVVVPINEKLQRRARRLIESDRYLDRSNGASALRHFKSDENIAILEGLLDDPKWAFQRHAQYNFGIEVRFFGVRSVAYEILKGWGRCVAKPTILEEHERFDLVQLIVLDDKQVKSGMLEMLPRFENLEILYLSRTSITDDDLRLVAKSQKVRELNLANTIISDEGLKHLAGMNSLRFLHAAHTRISANGVARLQEAIPELKVDR